MPSKRPTLADIAKKTGFSRSTVSLVFSDISKVLPQTRQIILQAAEEMGYQPLARPPAPSEQKTGRYGLLLPDLYNPYYSELVQCLDLETRRHGRSMILSMHRGDQGVAEALVRQWVTGLTDGIILDPPPYFDIPVLLDLIRSRRVPAVFLHSRPADDFCVVVNRRGPSYRRALRQLQDLGHKRIAYVGQESKSSRLTESYIEYKAAIEGMGQTLNDAYLYFGRDDASTGYEAVQKFHQANPPPTAVVCFNDILACGVYHGARTFGLRIPADLSVVGGDNVSETARLGLTTVHCDRVQMAREICRLLQMQEDGTEQLPRRMELPTELVIRESISFPRAD
jgi:DNA-binding LacI/PurR family transcriptional regulator